jgi:hypothetical protein
MMANSPTYNPPVTLPSPLIVQGSSTAEISIRTANRGMKLTVDDASGTAAFAADTDLNGFSFSRRIDVPSIRDFASGETRLTFDGSGTSVTDRFRFIQGADVASANTLTLGDDGNYFVITGVTTINGITTANWQAGSTVLLRFSGVLQITNASGAPGGGAVAILTHTGANVTTAANDIIPFVYDGTNWRIALI